MMFPHTEDPRWLEKRKKAWIQRFNHEYAEFHSEKQVNAAEKYFFSGDCDTYLKECDSAETYYILLLDSPVETLEQLVFVSKKYLDFAFGSEHNWFKYIPEGAKVVPGRLGLELLGFSLHDCSCHPPELMSEVFLHLMGKKYDPERRLYVDFAEKYGDTEFSIDATDILKKIHAGLRLYLFAGDHSEYFRHYKSFVDYYVSLLPYDTEVEKYSLQLVDPLDVDPTITDRIAKRKAIKELKRARSRQESIRKFFMGVYGYGADALDQDALKQLREGLETVKMPDAFYPFIDFIHRHKEKSIEVSE